MSNLELRPTNLKYRSKVGRSHAFRFGLKVCRPMPLTRARRTFNGALVATKLTSKSPAERAAIAELEKLMKRLQKDNADSAKAAAYLSHISMPLHALKVAGGDLFEALEALRAAEAIGDTTAAKSANREVNRHKRKLDKSRDELLQMVEMSKHSFKRKPKATA